MPESNVIPNNPPTSRSRRPIGGRSAAARYRGFSAYDRSPLRGPREIRPRAGRGYDGREADPSADAEERREDDPSPEGLYRVGTLATVLQLLKLPDQTVRVLVEGQDSRPGQDFFAANRFLSGDDRADRRRDRQRPRDRGAGALGEDQFRGYIKLNKKVPAERSLRLPRSDDPAKLADTVASHLTVKIPDRQQLLETLNTVERLERVLALIEGEIACCKSSARFAAA